MDPRYARRRPAAPPSLGTLFRLMSWRGILLLAVAGAMAVAIMVLAASVFLLLVPVLLVVGLIAKLWTGAKSGTGRAATARTAATPDLIEGRYEVVDADPLPGERPGPGGWGPRGR